MLFKTNSKDLELPSRETAIADRSEPVNFSPIHLVSGNPIIEPVPEGIHKAVFGLGCFWGAERLFWQLPGVFSTAVGYAGGITANPSYQDVCSGGTGHTEVVLVFFDPQLISYESLLASFWESHDPTQGMRQGNDRGTQYRSSIYALTEQQKLQAQQSAARFQEALAGKGYSEITTEISELNHFYYAEDYHQQYLAKNPNGYCSLAGTGTCLAPASAQANS